MFAPSRPTKLSVQWIGPGEIVQQLSDTSYIAKFHDKVKRSVYYVNMLKPYHQRAEKINLLCLKNDKNLDKKDMPNLELDHDASEWSKLISDDQQNSNLSQFQSIRTWWTVVLI